jgi:hypothetical protein
MYNEPIGRVSNPALQTKQFDVLLVPRVSSRWIGQMGEFISRNSSKPGEYRNLRSRLLIEAGVFIDWDVRLAWDLGNSSRNG